MRGVGGGGSGKGRNHAHVRTSTHACKPAHSPQRMHRYEAGVCTSFRCAMRTFEEEFWSVFVCELAQSLGAALVVIITVVDDARRHRGVVVCDRRV